jgi:GWxTD domain-containing protein
LSLVAVTLLLAGCGGSGGPGRPAPAGPASFGRPNETYAQLGLLAGPSVFPAVASFSTVAGPADSTYVLFGLSLPANALRFQRDETGFVGEYRVSVTFERDSQVVKRVERTEVVRVGSFAETGRTDESVVFQQVVALQPGTYDVSLSTGDLHSSRAFLSRDTLRVPAYGAGALDISEPVVVYRGAGRAARTAPPELILNPRRTVAYGGESPRVYVETYGSAVPVPVRISVQDEAGSEVWSTQAVIDDGDERIRHALVDLPAGSLPLGKLWLAIESPEGLRTGSRSPLVISISDQWMVANFDEVLEFLRYIATREELDSLGIGSAAERRMRWEEFWDRRDPLPASPINEYREQFFDRVRFATEQFGEPGGRPGWRTDRGEVFIVLGAPDFGQDRYVGESDVTGRPNAVEWLYENTPTGRLSLLFADRTGFGRFELTPSSEAAFRSVAERLKARVERGR